jgi:hypothetical protein
MSLHGARGVRNITSSVEFTRVLLPSFEQDALTKEIKKLFEIRTSFVVAENLVLVGLTLLGVEHAKLVESLDEAFLELKQLLLNVVAFCELDLGVFEFGQLLFDCSDATCSVVAALKDQAHFTLSRSHDGFPSIFDCELRNDQRSTNIVHSNKRVMRSAEEIVSVIVAIVAWILDVKSVERVAICDASSREFDFVSRLHARHVDHRVEAARIVGDLLELA